MSFCVEVTYPGNDCHGAEHEYVQIGNGHPLTVWFASAAARVGLGVGQQSTPMQLRALSDELFSSRRLMDAANIVASQCDGDTEALYSRWALARVLTLISQASTDPRATVSF